MQHNLTPGLLVKDRYKLMQRIGQGSFGEVWLAEDFLDQKYVAIKVYQWLDRDGMDTFAKEMETTKDLSHPNLLIPSEFSEWNQRPFFVMEYCGKGSVSQMAGRLTEEMAWAFIRDVSSGLAYLHGLYEPIVHQDVKPYNIVIGDDNSYKITDFGISTKVRDHLARHSDHRNPNAGALAYMAPERFTPYSSPLTSSDIWAFGVTVYELLSGRLPFSGMGGGMLKGGAEIPQIPSQYSAKLDRLVTACLQKETWDRPTAADIERYAEAMLRGENPVGRWEIAGAAAAAQIAPGISKEIKEMGEYKGEHEKGNGKGRTVLAAAVAGILVVGGLIFAAIKADGEEDLEDQQKSELALEDDAMTDGALPVDTDDVSEEEYSAADDEAAEGDGADAVTETVVDEVEIRTDNATTTAVVTQQKEDTRTRQQEAPVNQHTEGSGYAVTTTDGYKGPEDTGRPQNKVNRKDYSGYDRNGYVSRDASAAPTSKYANDKRMKKKGDPLPEPKNRPTEPSTKSTKLPIDTELKTAISRGDFQTIKRFADAGNANAYVPLADLYLRRNDYASAEMYAKKARAAGIASASRIFDMLRKMGYYD